MRSRFSATNLRSLRHALAPETPSALVERVYTSRLLGAEPALVVHGGGNTSAKGWAIELTGEPVEVLWVKGSGWDLETLEPDGLPACRLEPLRRLARLERLSDEAMVRGLRAQLLDPGAPTPSVEALLHALLPASVVDHTHADAVLALLTQPDGAERARDLWGEHALVIPYVMPGFELARAVATRLPFAPEVDVLLLDKHGIFTWGQSAEQSYEQMIRCVTQAEELLQRARAFVPAAPTSSELALDAAPLDEQRDRLSVLVRGALLRRGHPSTLTWRTEPVWTALAQHPRGRELSLRGPATPDHVLRVKPWPLWLPAAATQAELDAALDGYAADYDAFVTHGAARRQRVVQPLAGIPRVFIVPGLGALCAGDGHAGAAVTGDVALHDALVQLDAAALGDYQPVSALDLFDVEYWSLEQAKLARSARPRGALVGKVALVTGAASGLGLATARHFLEQGAEVMLTDLREDALEASAQALRRRFGEAVAHHVADVTSDAAVATLMRVVVRTFGGLDLLVSNAGSAPQGLLHEPEGDAALRDSLALNLLAHQTVARHAAEVLLRQAAGGALLFNASKSAFDPGPRFGPYAVPKAAVIALMKQYAVDLGEHGIRTGAVNADRIRTGLFDEATLRARALARGLSPEQYFQQNLLRRETRAEDVAQAFAWLATAQATTGLVVTVDGGNVAAFPR